MAGGSAPLTMWRAVAAALLVVWAGEAAAQATPAAAIPVEAFFSKPAIAEAELSPDGRQLALLSLNKEGHQQLVVLDTAKLTAHVAASFTQADIANVHWISDKRLVYSAADPDREVAAVVVPAGIYAVDSGGSDFRNLVEGHVAMQSAVRVKPLDFGARYLSPTWLRDSDDIFVLQPRFTHGLTTLRLLRVNTRTGAWTAFTPPGETMVWAVGPGDVPQFAVTREPAGRLATHHWDEASKTWTKLDEFDPYRGGTFRPIGFQGRTAYVLHRGPGDDFAGVYMLDPQAKQFSKEPLVHAKGFDLQAAIVRSGDQVLGVRYVVDGESTAWFDPAMKALQAKVDALMPGTVNRIDPPLRAEAPTVLVFAYADRDPGQLFLYDRESGKLVHIGRARPGIDPKRMARLDMTRIRARDGLELPVWTTTPQDGAKGPRPTVVLVHGGPWLRGESWHWAREAQFLASRGYAVVEPEYRGSAGYGFRLFRAGWKQWGLAMQDDIADATKWAIDRGIADPKRICIAGASYGGYAVLMGLAKNPELYRCGVDWVGVTDLELMYSASWSDLSDEYKAYGMPVLIGDRQRDAAQLRDTSPVNVASRIRQPLLLAYGAQDRRVPIEHGRRFHDAVAASDPDVEWVVYADEGHGWQQLRDNVDFWTRVEKFLARNIGGEAAATRP